MDFRYTLVHVHNNEMAQKTFEEDMENTATMLVEVRHMDYLLREEMFLCVHPR